MAFERLASLALTFILIIPSDVLGHQEERPDNLEMTIYSRLHGGGDEMELLVRTPLYLLTNVGLPLHGEHQVDPSAFGHEDPHAPGDATYAQRASAAVLKAIKITSDGSRIGFVTSDLRISASGSAAFADYPSAKKHVRRGLAGSDNGVGLHQGYMDLRAVANLPSDPGQLRLEANVGPALAKSLEIIVRQISVGGQSYATSLKDASGSKILLHHLQ